MEEFLGHLLGAIYFIVTMAIVGILAYLLDLSQRMHSGFYCWKCEGWQYSAPLFADDGALYLHTGCPNCDELPVASRTCKQCGHDTVYPWQSRHGAGRCIRWFCWRKYYHAI